MTLTAVEKSLSEALSQSLNRVYGFSPAPFALQETRREFSGTFTAVVFGWAKDLRLSPEVVGQAIGEDLVKTCTLVSGFSVVKGFLNMELNAIVWHSLFLTIRDDSAFGCKPISKEAPIALVEYASPNTNKPLHLGHLRNILLGHSVAKLLAADGQRVKRVQIINDRGIHICKSMLAWQKFGEGETPQSSGLKGDHLVGKYYVAFDVAYKAEVAQRVAQGSTEEEAKKSAPLLVEAQDMLRAWENNDPAVRHLWSTMNGWVYEGFNATYDRLGVSFDQNYYESDTYLLGKSDIERGLANGVFYRREDGSVWIDLTSDGLDEKVVLRKDGTSVYMTQDVGTAIQRSKDFNMDSMTYVVGNEQDYHFKVLFLILKKLGYDWADRLFHLSYGMVDLPTGRMKSREGTVVDADDLLDEMEQTAEALSEELGKLEGMPTQEKKDLYRTLGYGALKYYILKVEPTKRMVFNPEESIDFNGHTGPFIQYAHARIQSLLRKGQRVEYDVHSISWDAREEELVYQIAKFPSVVSAAANSHNPSLVAQYVYDLVKVFNGYYQNISILNAETPQIAAFRLDLSATVAYLLHKGLDLLGIEAPQRM